MSGDAEDVDASGVELHHEEHVRPSQQDGVDVEEVARQQPRALARAGTAASSDSRAVAPASDRRRHGSGGPSPPPLGSQAGPLRLGCAGSPIARSPAPTAAPAL